MAIITEQHRQAQTEFNKGIRKTPVWKGDHSRCEVGHADGLCFSIKAWRLNGEAKVVPVVVDRPTNNRFQSNVEYPDDSGKESEPAWRAKGWREVGETKFAKPIPEIVAKMRELAGLEIAREMQHLKASYEDQQKKVADFYAKFDAANGLVAEKPKGGSRG